MNDLRTAAQQALAFTMRDFASLRDFEAAKAVLYDILRAALAQQAEPVALDWLHKWAHQDDGEPETQWHEGYEAARRVVQIHLTAPPQRKPVTEEEIPALAEKAWKPSVYYDAKALLGTDGLVALVRAVEAKHNIKE